VEGKERVVLVVGEEIVLGNGELDTEQQGQQAANKEEEETEQEVHDADFLVVGGCQPRLEEAPEPSDGEGFWRRSVEGPQNSGEDERNGQADGGDENHEGTGTGSYGAGVHTGDHHVRNVPVIATRATATASVSVDRVAEHGHLDVEVICCRGRPFHGPRAHHVAFCRMGESVVHDVAEFIGDGVHFTVGDEDSEATVGDGASAIGNDTIAVKDHDVVDDGHREGVGFAGVVDLWQPVHHHGGVGASAPVTGTTEVACAVDATGCGGHLRGGHQGQKKKGKNNGDSSAHQ